MSGVQFTWDEKKNRENRHKHGLPFEIAQYAFADPNRVIAEDVGHSKTEKRYYCFGRIGSEVVTVRFTYRGQTIRIIGAGHWRRGKRVYEARNEEED